MSLLLIFPLPRGVKSLLALKVGILALHPVDLFIVEPLVQTVSPTERARTVTNWSGTLEMGSWELCKDRVARNLEKVL